MIVKKILRLLLSGYYLHTAACIPFFNKTEINGFNFDYSWNKIRGVNLGGWLLVEPWITPSLFERDGFTYVDEYSLCLDLGSEGCRRFLEPHWESFITWQDFVDMKEKYQLNFVRIPIGYWAYNLLPGDSFAQGQDEYLRRALNWAEQLDMKVWIDLHGLPGSQNGFDNSGRVGEIRFFESEQNQALAADIIGTISSRYLPRFADTIIGIELANEPFGPAIDLNKLMYYYNNGYFAVRGVDQNTPVVLHDAFLLDKNWMHKFTEPNQYHNIVYDYHHYVIFTYDLYGKPIQDVINTVCFWGREANQQPNPVVVGEWSAALTDCTKYLNGVSGVQEVRYENVFGQGSCLGKQNLETYSLEKREELVRYIEAQLDAYSFGNGAGWVFWTYKTEQSLEWDFRRLVDSGIFPPPPYTQRRYPNQCGFQS